MVDLSDDYCLSCMESLQGAFGPHRQVCLLFSKGMNNVDHFYYCILRYTIYSIGIFISIVFLTDFDVGFALR